MRDRSRTWGPRHYVAVAAALALGVATQVGCTPAQPTPPPAPITIINNNTNTNNNGGTPSSPSPGSNGAIATVKVGAFGLNCPTGVRLPNADRTIPVRCTMAVTCSPKDINGVLVSPAVTGPKPDFFDAVNGKATAVRVAAWDEEPFNINVTGLAAGAFSLSCISKGVKSDAWDGLVVAVSSSGYDHVVGAALVLPPYELTLRDFGPVR